MKKIVSIIIIALISFSLHAQTLRTINNTAFKRGEYLKYKVYYDAILTGKVVVGDAELEVKNENKTIANRNTFHVVGLGRSNSVCDMFFKVVDRYETYFDEQALVPWLFVRRVNEGGYTINQDVTFNQFKNITVAVDNKHNKTTTTATPANIQDVISSFYYMRTLDFSNAYNGEAFAVNFFLDDSVYTSKIIYEGKEDINIDCGTFHCLKFKPMVATGNVFKDPYPMTLWISDDKNHIPILAESAIIVGSVKLELIKFSGLANSFSSFVPKK
jgi:hypothetical protein